MKASIFYKHGSTFEPSTPQDEAYVFQCEIEVECGDLVTDAVLEEIFCRMNRGSHLEDMELLENRRSMSVGDRVRIPAEASGKPTAIWFEVAPIGWTEVTP